MANPLNRQTQKQQFKEPTNRDSYRSQLKEEGTPHCPICRSVCTRGRWLSVEQVEEKKGLVRSLLLNTSRELICPACRQQKDRYAMGVVELHGKAWREKEKMIINTIRNTEKILRHRNDQERILWIKESETEFKVYVSLPELARHIGRMLEKSFQGNTEYKRSTEEPYLRVRWQSDLPHMKHRPGAKKVFAPESHLLSSVLPKRSQVQNRAKSKYFRGRGFT